MAASSKARRSATRVVTATAAALLLAGLPQAGRAQLAPLFVIPVESAAMAPVPEGEPLQVTLYGHDVGALARALGAPAPAPDASQLDYTVVGYRGAASQSTRSWLEPSFVVDFDEPAVASLYAELLQARPGDVSRERLVAFVSELIDESPGRGWDVASQVATRRQGDCTEHAVLLTALARRAGLPARVALGVALVPANGRYAAYGHAWTEVLEDSRWVVADAALAGVAAPVRYLPLGVLEQEGPGFFVSAAAFLQRWPQRVVVGPVPSRPAARHTPAAVQ